MLTSSETSNQFELVKCSSGWVANYTAMACPCEIHLQVNEASEAERLASLGYYETIRIERKYSRYRTDNLVYMINNSQGSPVDLDSETLNLLKFAGDCFELSEGLFDITSGVLRRAWRFDGKEYSPDREFIESLLDLVGWEKVSLDGSLIRLLPGMELDLGGIGKEYAVDRVCQMVFDAAQAPVMVNFGGDIRAMSPGSLASAWAVGIEDPTHTGVPIGLVGLSHGAIATSGTSYRHCFVAGRKLGHILSPLTGWPVEETPKSVTVLADFCTEAGFLTTLAMLYGAGAEEFLSNQNVTHHCIRE